MTIHNTTIQELDEVMEGLDEIIRAGRTTRPFAKAVMDPEEDDCDTFPATVEGLAAYASSAPMRDILRDDPAAFRAKYLDFVLGHELVAKGLVSPQQVGIWSHRLSLLPGIARRGELSKAVTHTDAETRPYDFQSNEKGLAAFLHSPEMTQLRRERPAVWRREYMNFFSSMVPPPTPQEVSAKRIELEGSHPDHALSTVAKALVDGNRLTQGQSVLVQNFGVAFDPAVWLRS